MYQSGIPEGDRVNETTVDPVFLEDLLDEVSRKPGSTALMLARRMRTIGWTGFDLGSVEEALSLLDSRGEAVPSNGRPRRWAAVHRPGSDAPEKPQNSEQQTVPAVHHEATDMRSTPWVSLC